MSAGGADGQARGAAAAALPVAVDEALCARLDELLVELCAIPSPSGAEATVRARVGELAAAAGYPEQSVDEAGNLLARPRPDRGAASSALFCGHLDTVGDGVTPVEPVIVDDGWENRHDGILGADNKAALAVVIACLERWSAAGRRPPLCELLFTTGEEQALAGAKRVDVGALRSDVAYVYDNATPIGGLVVASPTYYRIEATLVGRAAHAGIRPELGRSAIVAAARAIASMPHGRIDAGATVNVGGIEGGSPGTNVVAERCTLRAEVRALEEERAVALVGEVTDALQRAASDPRDPCDLELRTERMFCGYRHRPDLPALVVAERALLACGHSVDYIETGGGSDANALLVAGLTAVTLANGTERNHEPTERVTRAALAEMARVTFALWDGLAAAAADERER